MSDIKKRKLEQPVKKRKNPFANAKHISPEMRDMIEHPEATRAEIERIYEKNKDLTEEEIDATFKPMGAVEWYNFITAPCRHFVVRYDVLRKEPFWPELETMLIRRYGRVPE